MKTVLRWSLNLVGGLLVLFGLGLLVYVGISYAHQASPSVRTWSNSQNKSGHSLASKLTGKQQVRVPRTVAAAPSGAPATRMVIPRIAVDVRVVQTPPENGIWNVADWAVGHLSTTPNPGEPGNGAYAAHDDIKGEIFKRVGELQPGNVVLLYAGRTVYRYVVTGQKLVDPSDVSVLAPTKAPAISLVTCAPYWVDTQRLVVQATLKSTSTA